uniref:Uncharacterized protein n=1 Tax=Arundo donax TaxID=35708 RepID=A0A0A9A1Z4_ARUDO
MTGKARSQQGLRLGFSMTVSPASGDGGSPAGDKTQILRG